MKRGAVVDAEGPRAERSDLQQSARDHDVLEEVDHLVLVGEVAVERHRRGEREQHQRGRDEASPEAGDQQDAAAELDGHGDGESQRREGQSHGTDHLSRQPVGTEFAEAAHGEGKADQQAAGEGKITGGVH